MNVKISVIIPVYNSEKYLHECLISILMQNFKEYEIICVDDKSTDNSLTILKEYYEKYKQIKIVINNENKGSGFSRNKALDIAKGKYIFFLDSDDWIDKDTLKITYDKCEKYNLDFIMFKNIVFYNEKNHFDYEHYYEMNFMNQYNGKIFNHWDLNPEYLFKLPVGPCNKLYNKTFLDKHNIRFPNEKLIQEDNPFFYKAITLAEKISILNLHLYNRRRRTGSIMSTLNDERLFSRIYIADMLVKYFLSNEKLYNKYKKNLFIFISKHFTNEPYNFIKSEFKEEMYNSIQNMYFTFFYEYNLKKDIMQSIDKTIINKFELDNI